MPAQLLSTRYPVQDLGDAIDLHNRALCYDGMHLTGAGNRRIAERLAAPVSAMLR